MSASDSRPRWGPLAPGADIGVLQTAVAEVLEVVAPGSRVVLALSGGPDSTGLALLTRGARPDLSLVAVHVRHGLREDAADATAAARTARRLGLAFREVAVTVEAAGEGPEAGARRARYAALVAVAREEQAVALLVGHTADDQAETVLLALGRGTGVRGLAGMSPVAAREGLPLLRPLLRVRRSDVRAVVTAAGLPTVTDPTNADPDQRRARVRSELLPMFARLSGGSGDPVAVLTRMADLARDDADALDAMAADLAVDICSWGPVRALPVAAVHGLPPALASRLVRRLLVAAAPDRPPPAAAAVATMLELAPGQAASLPGRLTATAGGGWLAVAPADLPQLPVRPVLVPGAVAVPEAGVSLHVGEVPAGELLTVVVPGPGEVGPVRLPAVPAAVRARRPGDRLQLASGPRRLAGLLARAAVPRPVRELLPVLVDGADAVLWVPGIGVRAGPPGADAPTVWLAPLPDPPR